MINAILCLLLMIGSAGALVDHYLLIDKKSHQEIQNFKNKSKRLLKQFNQDNKGFGTIIGISFTLLFSLLFYFFLLKIQTERKELLYRQKNYQCFFEYNRELKKYIGTIAKSNIALRALFVAEATGVLSPEAQTIMEGLVLYQNTSHISFMKYLLKDSHCPKHLIPIFISKLPYKTELSLKLSRNIDQTTILREEKWDLKFYTTPIGIRKKEAFFIDSKYQLKSAISTSPKISAEEMVLSNLKPLSGLASWFL